jgi:hypothetical protein
MQYDGINGRYVIPMAEVDAVEIRETANGVLTAGTGPEYCSAGKEDKPKWLMNHAVNCLALARRLERRESVTEQVAEHVVFMKHNGDVMCCCGYNPHHRSSSREDDYRRVSAHIKDETKERK